MARARGRIEDSAQVEVPGNRLANSGQDDRGNDDQDSVAPARPAGGQPGAGPVLPPEGDHRDDGQREGDERSEHDDR